MIYVGIDPGLSGALARLHPDFDGWNPVQVFDTPTAETGKGSRRDYIISAMSQLFDPHEKTYFAVLESVHAMPGQGVSSMFSMGRGLGLWEGILSAYSIPYIKVAPQTWKKAMMPDMPRDNKDSSRIAASRLFPSAAEYLKRKKDHGRAEALLMAEYGKRIHNK